MNIIKDFIRNSILIFIGKIKLIKSQEMSQNYLIQYGILSLILILASGLVDFNTLPGWEGRFGTEPNNSEGFLYSSILGISVKHWMWSIGLIVLFGFISSKPKAVAIYTGFTLFSILSPLIMYLFGLLGWLTVGLVATVLIGGYPLVRVWIDFGREE